MLKIVYTKQLFERLDDGFHFYWGGIETAYFNSYEEIIKWQVASVYPISIGEVKEIKRYKKK